MLRESEPGRASRLAFQSCGGHQSSLALVRQTTSARSGLRQSKCAATERHRPARPKKHLVFSFAIATASTAVTSKTVCKACRHSDSGASCQTRRGLPERPNTFSVLHERGLRAGSRTGVFPSRPSCSSRLAIRRERRDGRDDGMRWRPKTGDERSVRYLRAIPRRDRVAAWARWRSCRPVAAAGWRLNRSRDTQSG